MSTGRGPGSRRLLESTTAAIDRGDLNASVEFVFCNRERGEARGSDTFLDLIDELRLRPLALSFRDYRRRHADDKNWRSRYNRAVLDLIRPQPVDLLVLAGLLVVLDESVVSEIPTLNLHPAAPGGPVGTWQEVIRQQIVDHAPVSGAMTQLATGEVDQGPLISFCRFPLRGPPFDSLWSDRESASPLVPTNLDDTPLFQAIRNEGVRREVPLLMATLQALADGEVRLESGRVLDQNGVPVAGLDLTNEIERLLAMSR